MSKSQLFRLRMQKANGELELPWALKDWSYEEMKQEKKSMTTPTLRADVLDLYDAPEGSVWEDVLNRAKELRCDLATAQEELKAAEEHCRLYHCSANDLAKAERKAEEAARELQMRRTPLNAPGDEELIRQSGIQLRHCSCSGGSGDEAHADDCPLWLDVLAARQWWRDRHVVAWSCSQEAKGGKRCAQWCGHQKYCTAHTRDDIEIAALAAKGGGVS